MRTAHCACQVIRDVAPRLWPSPLWCRDPLAPRRLGTDGRDASTTLRPSPCGGVRGLRGSEPCKDICLWGLDGPHTLDTLEGFIRPQRAAHELDQPDEVPQAAYLPPVGP